MILKKRAQSISINTIVVAAIALVVMVLLVMIFTGNLTRWRRSTDRCESRGGVCIDEDYIEDRCSQEYQRVTRDYPCFDFEGKVDDDKVCCVTV